MRFTLQSLVLMIIALGLTACTESYQPKPMPRGYASYEETYKSSPGAKAKGVGYAFSVKDNQATVEDMRFAASDLVAKLDQTTSFTAQKVYLVPAANTPFYNTLDYLLRDELTKSGYTISSTPQNALPVYVFGHSAEPKEKNLSNDKYQNIYLGLGTGHPESGQMRTIGDVYEIPATGFTPIEAPEIKAPKVVKKAVSSTPSQTKAAPVKPKAPKNVGLPTALQRIE